MKKDNNNNNNNYRGYVRYSSLAMQMIVVIVGGTFGGFHLDKYLHTTPVFIVLCVVVAVVFSIYIAIKDVIKPKKP